MRRLAVILLLAACSKPAPPDPAWLSGLEKFHHQRDKIIGGDDGWITLVGRFNLKPGFNTVGSDPGSAAVLPADRAPPLAGKFVVEAGTLSFQPAEGVDVRLEGAPVKALTVNDDTHGKPTILELGSLRMHVIKRGNAFMLRVKDREHPARVAFKGLTWYEPDPALHVKAKLEPSPPGTTIPIVNVLNMTDEQPSPGRLVFTVKGSEHTLVALKEEGQTGLFIIFKDETAGHGTYPSGRFLDTPAVQADGTVDLDFNRAYSPPCAFTTFATCPLPPKENHLPLKIAAGETYAGGH
jgi:uncharacterized protein (DUF1684 family)